MGTGEASDCLYIKTLLQTAVTSGQLVQMYKSYGRSLSIELQ